MAFIYDLADTWNDAGTTFTAIKMNVTDTASASASLLMDLQVGGTSRAAINKNGILTVNTPDIADGATLFDFKENGTSKFSGTVRNGFTFNYGSSRVVRFQRDGFTQITIGDLGSIPRIVLGAGTIEWNPNISISGANDLILARDAANTLAQRNSTNAQTFNLYSTYTDANNYKRASFTQTATGLVLDSQYDGTGLEPDNILELKSGGSSKFKVTKIGSINSPSLSASLISGSHHRVYAGFTNRGNIYLDDGSDTVGFQGPMIIGGNTANTTAPRLQADGNHTLAQRNGTNAQTFNLYNTYTDASNYERGFIKWNSNEFQIGYDFAGTGNAQRDVRVSAGNGSYLLLDAAGAFNKTTLYSSFQLNLSEGTDVITLQSNFFPNVGDSIGLGGSATNTGTNGWDYLTLAERAADVDDPAEGRMTIWQSDGTGSGDDGDIMIKITAGGVTKTATLVDFSTI